LLGILDIPWPQHQGLVHQNWLTYWPRNHVATMPQAMFQ
jgi:hypothetical protein